jgi:hypothetical protein
LWIPLFLSPCSVWRKLEVVSRANAN